MAEEKTYPMTLEGKQKLEEELNTLKTAKRAEVIQRIKIARGVLAIFLKIQNMNPPKMSSLLLRVELRPLNRCLIMLR